MKSVRAAIWPRGKFALPEIAFILDGGHVLCVSLVARLERRRRVRRLSFRIVAAVTGTGGVISLLWQPVHLFLLRTKATKIVFFFTRPLCQTMAELIRPEGVKLADTSHPCPVFSAFEKQRSSSLKLEVKHKSKLADHVITWRMKSAGVGS